MEEPKKEPRFYPVWSERYQQWCVYDRNTLFNNNPSPVSGTWTDLESVAKASADRFNVLDEKKIY